MVITIGSDRISDLGVNPSVGSTVMCAKGSACILYTLLLQTDHRSCDHDSTEAEHLQLGLRRIKFVEDVSGCRLDVH